MYRAVIAIVDATRGRLFSFTRTKDVAEIREEMTEVTDLVNPSRRLRPSQLFSDSRPGTSRSGSLQYAFDDHRGAHIEELDAAFARLVIDAIGRLLAQTSSHRLILCASPNMLGELRDAADKLHCDGLIIDEHPRDLVKLTPSQLRKRLTEYGLLPAPGPRPGLV